MTNGPHDYSETEYDPASMAASSLVASRAVWFKRPWVVATLALLVVVAVSVVTDLPHPISKAEDASNQNGALKLINSDLSKCTYALTQAFQFYRQQLAGTLTHSQLSIVNTYLPSDQVVCSFAGPNMSDLTNNLQVQDTAAGKKIDALLKATINWMDPDADGAILDITKLFNHPGDSAALEDLTKREAQLAKDRRTALNDLASADAILGTHLYKLKLPVLTPLPGT